MIYGLIIIACLCAYFAFDKRKALKLYLWLFRGMNSGEQRDYFRRKEELRRAKLRQKMMFRRLPGLKKIGK